MTDTNTSRSSEQHAPCQRCRRAGPDDVPPSPPARTPGRGWIQAAAAVPAAVLPLLPSFTCPACLAAYAGVVSATGLGFLLDEAVLAPLIAFMLVLSVASVGWSTRSHRRPGPLLATIAGALGIAAGRLVWELPVVLYAGVAVLVAGSLWNLWLKMPRRRLVHAESPRQDPVGLPVESRS